MRLSSTTAQWNESSSLDQVSGKWGWIVALGAAYIIAGFVALGSMAMATVASVLVVGLMMIVAGIAELIGAFQIKSWARSILWALLGVLYIVAGFLTFDNPLLAAVWLTLLLGVSLLISGMVRILLAFSMTSQASWTWVLLSGLVTLLLGFIIVLRWPVNSIYILGLFLGVDLIVAGVGWVAIGLGLRKAGQRAQPRSS
ncbi:conserved membrane hypothetical protein [Bradyrhizobium sp. STM 3843]|uniref:HdeD family acid-resistance protein n=1 Tax=Bradyrhizobium sp. STM 3843 TaxID=551947 RepID=UPI000240405E|nr:HdeD family acid-resistance protein [Bradyrhizobium sp. STM 3843]CCE10365.1 conserved membrane hypothetical protein [Bradyrhizobium sp. STM 3843]